jgi:hypothetical protein
VASLTATISFGDNFVAWIWMCVGVLVSVALPPLSSYVRSQFGATTAATVNFKKYGALLMFSALTALVILAAYRAAKPNAQVAWYAALLAGYAWAATLEKLGFDPKS